MGNIKLNEQQKQAVEFDGGDLLIIAGAGTGKTSVLTQRILYLIKHDLAKPSEILALTFTEKAAQEMQDRVDEQMDYGYDEPAISTFHSFCDKVLREDGYNIGLDGSYSLMTGAQSYIFLRKRIYDLPLKTLMPKGNPRQFINDFLKHVSRLQDEDVSPEEYLQYSSSLPNGSVVENEEYLKTKELAETYKVYSDLKIANSKADFGDLIILTLKLFRERKNVLDKYRKRFKYILVDEFQDTNYTQNVLINTLVLGDSDVKDSIRPKLTVVGDDDQAIYKFRGAAISNILQFKQVYKDAKEIVLVDNYRSKQEILDSAYTLIRHNNPYRLEVTENVDKRLVAKGLFDDDIDSVNLIVTKRDAMEAEKVTDEILDLTGYGELINTDSCLSAQTFNESGQSTFLEDKAKEGKYKFSDIAILVRANSNAEAFIQALRQKGVPYKLGGARGLYFREEIQYLISFLRVLFDYNDEVSMYKLLSMPIWHLTAREYISLGNLARKNNKIPIFEELEELWNVTLGDDSTNEDEIKSIENPILDKTLSMEAIAGVSSLLCILDSSIKKIKENRSILEILYDFLTESGYLNSFLDNETPESLFAVSNINKYFELVKKYEKDNPDTNLYEYVDYLNYCIEIGESPLVDQLDMDDLNAVNIMTVHASKGLEFPVVFMVNLVAQRFPAQGRSDGIPIPEKLIKELPMDGVDEKESNLQEERRLFYVGATRAKERLYLTAANFYDDAKRRKKPSIFLNEILDRNIEEDFDVANIGEVTDDVVHLKFIDKDNYESIVPKCEKICPLSKFSYTSLNTYEICPRRYEFANVLNIPSKPHSALSFGSAVHNTLYNFYSLLKQSKEGLNGVVNVPTLDDLLDLYEQNWTRSGFENKKQESDRKEEGIEILKNYYENVFSPSENPFMLEVKFDTNLGGTVFTGKIDRIDTVSNDGGVHKVCIIDYKTGKDKSDADIKKDLQLPLYALFAENKFGVRVVAAKYIFIESCNVVDVDISDGRREFAKDKLLEVLELIKNKEFRPNPGWGCRFCDYSSICDYADV